MGLSQRRAEKPTSLMGVCLLALDRIKSAVVLFYFYFRT